MSVVVPALLAANKEELEQLIARVQPFATRIHIDVMDGLFAPTAGIVPEDIAWPEGIEADIHLMYKDPSSQFNALVALKPSLVIFHAEAEGNLLGLAQAFQQAGIKVGISLMRSTVPSDVAGLIGIVDHVLIFSGNLGQYGGTANMLQIEKVRLVRAINPTVEIGWDGGANVSNAYTITLGGVDILNVGSALAQTADPAEVFRRLDFEVHRKDILKNQKKENEG